MHIKPLPDGVTTDFRDPDHYNAFLKANYMAHLKMIHKGHLDVEGGLVSSDVKDSPNSFGYWQVRLTKNDIAKHYASAVFAIHRTHDYGAWNLSEEEMKEKQLELAGSQEHLTHIKKFAKNFAAKLNAQGITYVGTSLVDEPRPDVNSDIHRYIKENAEMKQLITQKLVELIIESEKDEFGNTPADYARIANRSREIKNSELGYGTNRATAMAPPEVAPYQGGSKKKAGSVTDGPRAMHAFIIWSFARDPHNKSVRVEDYAHAIDGVDVAKDRLHYVVANHVNHLSGKRVFVLTGLSGPDQGDGKANRDYFIDHMRKVAPPGSSASGVSFLAKKRAKGDLSFDEHGYQTIDLYHKDTSDPDFVDAKTYDTFEAAKQHYNIGAHPDGKDLDWSTVR